MTSTLSQVLALLSFFFSAVCTNYQPLRMNKNVIAEVHLQDILTVERFLRPRELNNTSRGQTMTQQAAKKSNLWIVPGKMTYNRMQRAR
jgi:hypothetical protein